MPPVIERVARSGIVPGAQRDAPPAARGPVRRQGGGLIARVGIGPHRDRAGARERVGDGQGIRRYLTGRAALL